MTLFKVTHQTSVIGITIKMSLFKSELKLML